MPNHVYNSLSVSGEPEDIKAFAEKARIIHPTNPEGANEIAEFSYWNFVTPPQESIDSGEYWATRGYVNGEESGRTPNNWYQFNNREWGTKWDAYDVYVQQAPRAYYATFSSAWSPPIPVFEAMTEQHPSLTFNFGWEEEQGWGGEGSGYDGHFVVVQEWDIPGSHADYEDIGRDCMCERGEDKEYWFKDCPENKVPDHEGCNCEHHQKAGA